jgi:hypothetical protein
MFAGAKMAAGPVPTLVFPSLATVLNTTDRAIGPEPAVTLTLPRAMISEQEQLGRSETLLANDGYFSEANVIASTTNFLIIARTDSCRFFGVEEAAKRVNAAAKVGADMGLIFPRDPDEATRAPKLTQVPLIYVQSLGNRDGRPTFSRQELQTMGYAGCIEAQFAMLYAFTAMRKALQALTPSRWSSSETHRRWPRTCRPMRRRPNIRSA